MITGALLPSSSPTFLRGARAADPPADLGRAGERDRARCRGGRRAGRRRSPPLPVTTLRCPAGSPHSSSSSSASAIADSGVCDAGFSTTGHPAAIAGATLWATRLSGKLNGLIAPTTPIGHAQRERELALADVGRVHRHHLARERARLDRGERERRHRACRLDARGLDRLGRLLGDDAGELLGALVEQHGRRGRGSRRAATAGAAPARCASTRGRDRALDLRRRRTRARCPISWPSNGERTTSSSPCRSLIHSSPIGMAVASVARQLLSAASAGIDGCVVSSTSRSSTFSSSARLRRAPQISSSASSPIADAAAPAPATG